MLVTSDLKEVRSFFETMHRGDEAYGMEINPDKSKANIDLDIEGEYIEVHKEFFPWCGMLFDTSSGEVRMDYSRYASGKCADSLTVDRNKHQGDQLRFQMKVFVRSRCSPVLFDPSINSLRNQIVNFYQNLVYGAIKTAEYLRCLQSSADGSAAQTNPGFVIGCMANTIEFAFNLIRSHLNKLNDLSGQCLQRGTAMWLGWKSFHDVFFRLSDFCQFAQRYIQPKFDSMRHSSLEPLIRSAMVDMKLDQLIAARAQEQGGLEKNHRVTKEG